MSTGFLMFPVGYAPTNDGAVVPGGKLTFSRTGTSTLQDTFTDSSLTPGNENSNPVVLNPEGYLDTKVYGDPTTGFKYRIKFTDANDVQIWQHDDVNVIGDDLTTIVEGSFTGTLTGYASGPTGTVSYKVIADASGVGKKCTLRIAADITGTSNATTMTMTGLPAAVSPTVNVRVLCDLFDNSGSYVGVAVISASGTTITFAIDQPFVSNGFTNSGTKGLSSGWQIDYDL